MSRLILATLLAAAALTSSAGAASAAEPIGLWATPDHNGKVQVYACGAALCGRIVDGDPLRADPNQKDVHNKDPALRGRPVKGLVIFSGYAGGPKAWKGGPFYDPQKGDRSRTGTVTLSGDNELIVKGCIGPLCRSERWKRVK